MTVLGILIPDKAEYPKMFHSNLYKSRIRTFLLNCMLMTFLISFGLLYEGNLANTSDWLKGKSEWREVVLDRVTMASWILYLNK